MNRGALSIVTGCGAAVCVAGAAWFFSRPTMSTSAAELVAVSSVAQPEAVEPTPEQMFEMMEAEGKPGPEHARLNPLVGIWKAEMSFLTEPGSKPDVTYGTSTNTWVLGDKFISMDFTGEITMMGRDFPFNGMGLMGFDRARGEYTMAWADSLSSQMLFFTGKPGDDAGEVALMGSMLTPNGPMPAKYVYKIESDDKYVLEFWQSVPDMDEMMKIGWITHTRKAD